MFNGKVRMYVFLVYIVYEFEGNPRMLCCSKLCSSLFELVLHIISYYIALKPGFSSLESYERAWDQG